MLQLVYFGVEFSELAVHSQSKLTGMLCSNALVYVHWWKLEGPKSVRDWTNRQQSRKYQHYWKIASDKTSWGGGDSVRSRIKGIRDWDRRATNFEIVRRVLRLRCRWNSLLVLT